MEKVFVTILIKVESSGGIEMDYYSSLEYLLYAGRIPLVCHHHDGWEWLKRSSNMMKKTGENEREFQIRLAIKNISFLIENN